jgi:tRNA dimethylallyltransferase
MDPAVFDDALILTGPTASGKSTVGLLIAERFGAEIISMDSMALYRGMDVGTAKPSAEERARAPHHLIDVLDPWQPSSLAWWLREAAACCEAIRARGRKILFVGGTPLYLKGLLHGIFEGPAADADLRHRLEQESSPALHARLSQVDPATAKKLHPNDVRRMVRALEVLELTGTLMSAWQRQFDQVRPRERPPLWLDWPRAILYDRINRRVVQMISNGLLDEAKRLSQLPHPLSKEARQAAGYKEVFEHLQGRISVAEMTEQIQTRSRQLAKRQLTWFRHWKECRPLTVLPTQSPDDIAARAIEFWFAKGDHT